MKVMFQPKYNQRCLPPCNLTFCSNIFHILEDFCLTLFKRIRPKLSEKDEVSHLYKSTVDEKEKEKKAPS